MHFFASKSRPRLTWAAAAVAALALLGATGSARAQLRPIEPLQWEVFSGADATAGAARIGAGILGGQRASLAGTEGRLLELGNFAATWRAGRVALEVGGTAVRRFHDRSRWADTAFGAAPGLLTRTDAGDLRVGTAVRLTPERLPVLALLRFGARLPTTSAARGLDRGQTDFLGTAAVAWRRGALLAAAESGIGILGTRIPAFEQQDDWIYTATVAWQVGRLAPRVDFTGQSSPLRYRRIRGNEDLRELRLGMRAGGARWLELQWVRGLTAFSPRSGLLLSAGLTPLHRSR